MSKIIQKEDTLKLQFGLNKKYSNINKLVEFLSDDEFMRAWHGAKVKINVSDDKKTIDFSFKETFDYGKTHNGFDMMIHLPDVGERGKIADKPVVCEIKNAFSEPSILMDGDIHENRIYQAVETLNSMVAEKGSMSFAMNDMKMMPFTGKNNDDSLHEFLCIVKGSEDIKETTAILDGWSSDTTLVLGNLFENDINDVFHPQCSFVVDKFVRDSNDYLYNAQNSLNDEDMKIAVDYLIEEVTEKFDKTIAKVENGLRADEPFTVKYNECGSEDEVTYFDKCVSTLYPTKIDGLFISKSQMGTDFDNNTYSYDVVLIDGKQLAERANGGKYKVKGNRQKKVVDLTPEVKVTKENENVRKD